MKQAHKNSCEKKKPPIHQNPAHIIKEIVALREKYPQNNQFSAHITKEGRMEGWVGLVLYFINEKKKRIDGFWQIQLGSHFAEKLCPRKDKCQHSITTLLVAAQIIVLHKKGRKGLYSNVYRLSDEWANFLPSHFKLNEWQKKRLEKAHLWAKQQQYLRHPCLHWIDNCIARTTLPDTEELRLALQTPNKAQSAKQVMGFLQGHLPLEKQKVTKAGYCGTFYPRIWSLPTELVRTLRIDGEEIAQLDITAAHPSTLPSIIRIWGKGISGINEEAAKLARELESGRIYNQLAKETGLSPEKAKKRFLSALNGKHKHTYNDPTFRVFSEMFPLAARVLKKIRQKDPKELNIEMASTLAKGIEKAIVTLWEYEIPVYPRGDEIVCRKRDEEFVREILAGYFFDATGVKALVGKKTVSYLSVWDYIKEDNLPENTLSTFKSDFSPIKFEKREAVTKDPHQDSEAKRIAGELLKLHECGVIKVEDDPDVRFFASVIHKFKATIPIESFIAA